MTPNVVTFSPLFSLWLIFGILWIGFWGWAFFYIIRGIYRFFHLVNVAAEMEKYQVSCPHCYAPVDPRPTYDIKINVLMVNTICRHCTREIPADAGSPGVIWNPGE